MKKLLSSALLVGLLLGTASPVFAATGDFEVNGQAQEGEDTVTGNGVGINGTSTPITSSITASYKVTIPKGLTIVKSVGSNNFSPSEGEVVLTDLTAAGKISVEATATNLTLAGDISKANQTLTTKLTDGSSTEALSVFDLEDVNIPQHIQVETTESSAANLPGSYTGTIDFIFNYVEESPM